MAAMRSRAPAARWRPSGMASIRVSRLRAKCGAMVGANFGEELFDFAEDDDVFGVGFVEHAAG